MAITFSNEDEAPKVRATPVSGMEFSPDKFEVYGRLNLSPKEISQLEGITPAQVAQIMRRPELREGYDRGRAQCVLALRQKVVSMALAGDTRVLLHAVEKFGNLEAGHQQGIPDTYSPEQFSWDGKARDHLTNLRNRYIDSTEVEPQAQASGD